MAGKKKTHALPCFSAKLLKRLWQPYSLGKIQVRPSFVNGLPAKVLVCTIHTATPGIACSSKGSCCSPDFVRKHGLRFGSHGAISKLRFQDMWQVRTTLSH